MSLLISSLSEEALPLAVGVNTSHEFWTVLETSLASTSTTRILQIHMQIQNIKQSDQTVTQFLHKAKALSDELTTADQPLSLADFNIYVFWGLNASFRDLVTTLAARSTQVTFPELHSLLLSYEFIHSDGFSFVQISTPTNPIPQANTSQRSNGSNDRGRSPNYHGRDPAPSGMESEELPPKSAEPAKAKYPGPNDSVSLKFWLTSIGLVGSLQRDQQLFSLPLSG
ncbi:hypothetical protein Vadar_018559 [Vaccinium darrowii]|uniref:Uncharacterized protein n=1 Tax=Vaccinium darrowii TaxID=229202 RepID=A0ACB7XRL4_9ERIC|nr:hypothetical protein Vadar_018559 [Vaccinium darrowii]